MLNYLVFSLLSLAGWVCAPDSRFSEAYMCKKKKKKKELGGQKYLFLERN